MSARAYYNEFDPKAAAWLRELIGRGLIAPGDVDERSITEVKPSDLDGYAQCHFFAGIGGWSYALRLAGIPDSIPIWTGSCPCQPFSAAGKQQGTKDERHLWPSFARLIEAVRPATVFGEQVASKAGREWLAGVFADLEGMGYCRAAADLCAASIGAPHIRQRLYWAANTLSEQTIATDAEGLHAELSCGCVTGGLADANGGECGNGGIQSSRQHGQQPKDGGSLRVEHTTSNGREQRRAESSGRCTTCGRGFVGMVNSVCERRCGGESGCENAGNAWIAGEALLCTDGKTRRIEPGSFPLAHGVSGRVGLLRGYGNAIVPQVAAEFVAACFECFSPERSAA